ncbi:hypothetical protein DYB37_009775 [Aphanomyces astaci]|uniref:Cyclic nucleotide-binding domain-containing protein n=1 Tax=Aphanomyces astaci TaxID=112090 RepID=A0A3R6ZFQ2_APHAT|nr:hypothetical protein DYB35_008983 [Aphanomyces astaci]RHZ21228.1 hypothetical protein DYB37_009775 [Aphanomyces astaci]
MGLSREQQKDCVEKFSTVRMFAFCNERALQKLCAQAVPEAHPKGSVLFQQGLPQAKMLVISRGTVGETKDINGQIHSWGETTPGMALGSNHALRQDGASATAKCLTPVVAYSLDSQSLSTLLKDPEIATDVMYSLNREVRRHMNLLNTPLLEQHAKPTPIFATSVAAAVESFYRSALNSYLNARLTGQAPATLFPNMGVQIPTRVAYINGFKGLRHYLEKNIDDDAYENPGYVRIAKAIAPGIIMTPVSSMLEACNAGHMNPESLATRWIRGLAPRAVREIIFGVGLNQLSDYCEERIPLDDSQPILKNALGSMFAGVVAGYFSHVPHNLSTLKLMNPQKSYARHLNDLVEHANSRVPTNIQSPQARRVLATALAFVFPKGLTIRTTQIVGSFIILNGTINSLKDFDVYNMPTAVSSVLTR